MHSWVTVICQSVYVSVCQCLSLLSLVLLVSLFLLFAFAFSLYILVGGLSEFHDVGYAFLTVFRFMLGELPYDTYVRLDVAGGLTFGKLVLTFILAYLVT